VILFYLDDRPGDKVPDNLRFKNTVNGPGEFFFPGLAVCKLCCPGQNKGNKKENKFRTHRL